MKRQLLLLLIFISSSLAQLMHAQVTPVASTVGSEIWYTIESAAVTATGTPDATVTGILPMANKGYVLYSPTAAGFVKYRIAAGSDDEKWAIVKIGNPEIQYLKNKGTGLFLVSSHSVGTSSTDAFVFNSLGSDQFTIRNNSSASVAVAWNSFTLNRFSTFAANTTTAWVFKAVDQTPKGNLGTAITAANTAKTALISEDPGYISSTSQAAIDLTTAIATAQAVFNSIVTDVEYTTAQTTLEAAVTTFNAAPKNPITLSTAGNDTWYYIVNGSDVTYCAGKAMINRSTDATDAKIQFGTKIADPNMLWKLVDAGNGKYGIQNRASGKYISTTITNGTQSAVGAYTLTAINTGCFKINSGAGDLHPESASSNIVTFNEDGTKRSTWKLQKISATDAQTPMSVSGITVNQGRLLTGKGNTNFVVLNFTAQVSGFTGMATLESIKMNLTGTTNLTDIENLRIYKFATAKFDPTTATLIGTGTIASGVITVTPTTPLDLVSGTSNFCVVVDVKESATEGNLIDASVLGMKLVGATENLAATPSPANAATIFLTQSILFSPGDFFSQGGTTDNEKTPKSFRIPSIVTAKDGSLITSTDKRNDHSGDLAANIDQYVRRSTDNGKTWSNVLMTCGAGTSLGYGDPALVVDRVTGKIICLVVHDKGFFGSTATAPIKIIYMESVDNGISWSAPKDITNQIYGAGCTNPATKDWKGLFISSGRGLQLRSGRIMFAGVVRNASSSNLQVHSVYTDDLGQTWKVGTTSAINGGDESKFAERNNGNVIVSIRNAGKREWNVSTDKGLNWGTASNHTDLTDPNCNGEMMTYTSTIDGYNKNRMLHSLCYAGNRTNVSMLLSYDEGVTFPIRKTICAGASAYSTFTILPDGTIGMYYEDGSTGNTYDMMFVRFSLNWLTEGVDNYTAPITDVNETSQKNILAKVQNDHIVLSGTDADYKIFDISGVEISKKTKVRTGVYFVKVENKTIKLMVK